jgi:hypothetical protein
LLACHALINRKALQLAEKRFSPIPQQELEQLPATGRRRQALRLLGKLTKWSARQPLAQVPQSVRVDTDSYGHTAPSICRASAG